MHQYSISKAVFKDRKTKKKENDRKRWASGGFLRLDLRFTGKHRGLRLIFNRKTHLEPVFFS